MIRLKQLVDLHNFRQLRDLLINDAKNIDAFWEIALQQNLFGDPERDGTAKDITAAIRNMHEQINVYMSTPSQDQDLTWYRRILTALHPGPHIPSINLKKMKQAHIQASDLIENIQKSTRNRVKNIYLTQMAYGEELSEIVRSPDFPADSQGSLPPLNRPTYSEKPKIPSENQDYSVETLQPETDDLLVWWNHGSNTQDINDTEDLPRNVYDLGDQLKRMTQKLIFVMESTDGPYGRYKAYAETAQCLCTDVRDLIILFTRRFVSRQDDVDIIREYVEMTIPALFAIWRFLPSLRYCDDFDMDSRFQQETEFIKNTLYTIKTNCMNNEVKNLTITLPTLSIEGAMHFSEGVYRSLDMLKNSTLDPEEIEYEFDRRILSVKRASLVEEKEYDALDQHHYMMDDVVEELLKLNIPFVEVREGIDIPEPIHSGAHGSVYRAMGFSSQKHLAVKVPHMSLKAVQAFIREARVWSRVGRQNNILTFRGYTKNRNFNYPGLVSDYQLKGNILSYMADKTNRVGPVDKLHLAKGVARGLQQLHALDIRHGDVRADNVLVTEERQALLHDFGLSTIATDLVTINDNVTNSLWLAPELKNVDQNVRRVHTVGSDMYSFGCLLYEIAKEELPDALLQLSVLEAHGNELSVKAPDGIPKTLWLLIFDCWNPDPLARPKAYRCIAHLRHLAETSG